MYHPVVWFMFHIKAWISNWIPKNTSRKWTLLSLPRHHLEPERRTDSGRERGSCLSTSWQEISPPTSTYLSKSLIQSPLFFVFVSLTMGDGPPNLASDWKKSWKIWSTSGIWFALASRGTFLANLHAITGGIILSFFASSCWAYTH